MRTRVALISAASAIVAIILIMALLWVLTGNSSRTTSLPADSAPTPTPTPAGPAGPPYLTIADLGVRLAYARVDASGIGQLVLHNPDETTVDVTGARGVFSGIAWSPDGSKLAVSFGPTAASQDIYIVNADSNLLTKVTDDGHSRRPTWSPDGATLAFVNSAAEGDGPIVTMPATGAVATALSQGGSGDNPAWAPDGSSIAASLGSGTVALLSPTTGAPARQVQVLRDASPSPTSLAWSPDSKAVTGVVMTSRGLAIVVLGDNLTSQRQVGGGFLGAPTDAAAPHPSFVAGGQKLIAASQDSGAIVVVDINAGPNELPSDAPYAPVQVIVPPPTGTHLAYPAATPVGGGRPFGSLV